MLQPVTKVILSRKPKLHVNQKSLGDQLEANPEQNVKTKGQKSKCQLFPLAVTSIVNHEIIKGRKISPLQHQTHISPGHFHNHSALLKPYFHGPLNKPQSNLALRRNIKKSSGKFLIFKSKCEQGAIIKNGEESEKNIEIFKEKTSDEEQVNSVSKRKFLECFSNSLHLENMENLKNRDTLLFPPLPKNDIANWQQISNAKDCLQRNFFKTKRFLQVRLGEEAKKMNRWKQTNGNQPMFRNSLPQIKNLPKNSLWTSLNGAAQDPRKRNLLLDWYTYHIYHPLSCQYWTSIKDKNDIEIVGSHLALQDLQRNHTNQSNIFTPVCNESEIKIAECFRDEASSSNKIHSGYNVNRFSQNTVSHNYFIQETDSNILLQKKICKRGIKKKQSSSIPTHTILANVNLEEEGKKLSPWNHFTQQKPIEMPLSVLKQFKTKNNTRTIIANRENLKMNVQSKFMENLTEKNLLHKT